MQKTGQIERTVDREFAEEEGRYKTCVWVLDSWHGKSVWMADKRGRMEKETMNLQKEAKTYLDSMRCKCSCSINKLLG